MTIDLNERTLTQLTSKHEKVENMKIAKIRNVGTSIYNK